MIPAQNVVACLAPVAPNQAPARCRLNIQDRD